MRKSFENIRVLLIQARNTADMEAQEQECFLERCRLRHDQLDSLNIARTHFHDNILEGYDALFIGGAGEYSACDDYPWTDELLDVVRTVYRLEFPTFGSCWGHQIIARALGGRVEKDPQRAEMGCRPIQLTRAGTEDLLFRDFPSSFQANTGHHDRVVELPPGGIELAFNESQPNQAFRLAGKPIFGTQFHSELDAHRERERIFRYRNYYLDELGDEETCQRVLEELAETTEVDHLMNDFLKKFVVY